MDPTIKEKQNNGSQEKKSGGGISQGINTLNNLGGLKSPFGKTGSRVAAQAGKVAAQTTTRFSAFLFTTPTGWVILSIILILIITFVIVLPLGAPPTETSTQTTNPIITPTPAP